MSLLKLNNIECRYDDNVIISDLSLSIAKGEIASFLGPSGCGKTTVLRAIAGFEPIYKGDIYLDGTHLSSPSSQLSPEHRNLGMVFQDYALFPHLSIYNNIGFGLSNKNTSERKKQCDSLLELVGLKGLGERFPHELSGGQQQRVALARAMAPKPKLILMDEPFSNLDVELRRRLASDVRDILKEQGISAILVTHDQEEAFAVADQVGILNDKTLQQWDTPFNLYHEPTNRFTANFVGHGRFIRGNAASPNEIQTELGLLTGNRAYKLALNEPVDVLLRPDDIIQDPSSNIRATVTHKTFAGAATLYELKLSTGTLVQGHFSSHVDFQIGEQIGIKLNKDHLVTFPVN
jgi:iron(III) transport system ATP-binding protein